MGTRPRLASAFIRARATAALQLLVMVHCLMIYVAIKPGSGAGNFRQAVLSSKLIHSANDREDRGNVGIIRSPIRASILPD
jgi:hypothetical protein